MVPPLCSIMPTTDTTPSHPVRYTRNVQRSGGRRMDFMRVGWKGCVRRGFYANLMQTSSIRLHCDTWITLRHNVTRLFHTRARSSGG